MNKNDRRILIETLEQSLVDHENIMGGIYEKINHLNEAERQDEVKLFVERTGLSLTDSYVLNVTEEFDDYALTFLTEQDRGKDLERWIQHKEGDLTIYNYGFEDDIPVIDVMWTEVEYRKAGPYFENGIARVPLHRITFRNTPIEIIKAMYQEEQS